jgi:hypothetical protein
MEATDTCKLCGVQPLDICVYRQTVHFWIVLFAANMYIAHRQLRICRIEAQLYCIGSSCRSI